MSYPKIEFLFLSEEDMIKAWPDVLMQWRML